MRIILATILGLTLSACASKPKPPVETPPAAPSAPAQVQAPEAATPVEAAGALTPANTHTPVAAAAAKEAEGLNIALKKVGAKTAKIAEAQAPHTAPAAHTSTSRGPVPADKSFGWLKNGNARFVKHSLRNDGDTAKDRTRLAAGQKPHAIILSCSDSRTPPEVVFDQKLGEIFVIRTAGETLDFGAIASIEYAIAHLGSNLILVMGHESCGAVKAAHATLDGSDAGSPSLNNLVHDLQPHLKSFAGKPLSEGGVIEGWANTEGVAKDLVARSQIVRDALNSGEVKIKTALYHLGSGVVDFR